MANSQLDKMKDTADIMAARDGKDYVVVDLGGDYQIWPKSIVEKNGRNCVYTTDINAVQVNEWDDLLS